MRIALIRNGQVENIIEADPEWARGVYPDHTVVPATPALEQEYSSRNSPPARTTMTKYQFRRRFTMEELVKFDNPEMFLPNLTPQQKAIIRTLTRSFDAAQEIDLTDPTLQYGMNLMVEWGLLTPERKAEIMDPTR